tara:strand:+ start:690 stop:1088 length:399 start_codon:yes stop_codon:yes gene_type:complete
MNNWEKFLKEELDGEGIEKPLEDCRFQYLCLTISWNVENDWEEYKAQELRIICEEADHREVMTDMICTESLSSGEIIVISGYPDWEDSPYEGSHSNSDWLTWDEIVKFLNSMKTMNYSDLSKDKKHDFRYIE